MNEYRLHNKMVRVLLTQFCYPFLATPQTPIHEKTEDHEKVSVFRFWSTPMIGTASKTFQDSHETSRMSYFEHPDEAKTRGPARCSNHPAPSFPVCLPTRLESKMSPCLFFIGKFLLPLPFDYSELRPSTSRCHGPRPEWEHFEN